MFCAYTRPKYQVSVYRTIGPLVLSPHLNERVDRYTRFWPLSGIQHRMFRIPLESHIRLNVHVNKDTMSYYNNTCNI